MAPPGWHRIEPQGLSTAILAVAVTFSVVSTIVISLRVAVRVWHRIFAIEDWLMCIGYVINMVHNSVISYGTFTGLGAPDSRIPGGPTGPIYMEGIKSVFLWQIFFLSGFVFIKCSICMTLLRISVVRWHRITLWALIAITVISTIFVDIYILLQCRPIQRTWGEKEGTCLPSTITVAITFVISALNLITDFTTAVLPFLMLRKVQMSKNRKIAITLVLSLGVLASIATIARLPFGTAYFATKNYLVGIGDIILWTVVECDLALIAGSLPMLRTLFKGLSQGSTDKKHYYNQQSELVTIGRKGYRRQTDNSRDQNENQGSSESVQGITIKQDHVIIHEDRSLDRQELGPTYHAQTYV
ncbi:hypothetical protein NKR23_g6557 [Pleurostoma richardsiae]|uniref:Rhodopsin domain-containing protein n=1 Tax=Pleurostoma richardsiae TaxID=41990 RepID=A0AA38RD86_9PEZI|nr:hypothetical protein NKR23_g6557 [Pleurostoma richardsiae]